MLNFTSALYLGLRHSSSSLQPWSQFTTGAPAALFSPRAAEKIADQIAALQGCVHGVLSSSTLHLFWDLFGILGRQDLTVYLDAGAYPIARWGVERAAGRGVPVRKFAHHDADALRNELRSDRQTWPLVVTDGFCPDCGKGAPLGAYLKCVQESGGFLIVDDTQALGIFGHSLGADALYGREGGGMLPRLQISGPEIIVISSLAKAFAAPLAVLSGSRKAVEQFKAKSETRVHCSPPSVASIRAAEHALVINRKHGDRLRQRLARSVVHFRRGVAKAGFQFSGGLFPVQTLTLSPKVDIIGLHRGLLRQGVRTVLHRSAHKSDLRISFVITARHKPEEIERAVEVLAHASEARSISLQPL